MISLLPIASCDISHIMRFCLSSGPSLALQTAVLITTRVVICQPLGNHGGFPLEIPETALGASIKHDPSFVSFSFEPAFWVEFFGNSSSPNELAFNLLDLIVAHGGQPTVSLPFCASSYLCSYILLDSTRWHHDGFHDLRFISW